MSNVPPGFGVPDWSVTFDQWGLVWILVAAFVMGGLLWLLPYASRPAHKRRRARPTPTRPLRRHLRRVA
jgi:hypothetical protein